MFKFRNSDYFHFLYLIPLLIVLYWYTHRQSVKALSEFASTKLHKVLFPLRSRMKSFVKFDIVLVSIILLIFTLADPQCGTRIEEIKQVGIDVFILLDV